MVQLTMLGMDIICGQNPFNGVEKVFGELWYLENNQLCTKSSTTSQMLIEIDCGNGIQGLILKNDLSQDCCGAACDPLLLDYENEFIITDNCTITSENSYNPVIVPPCAIGQGSSD
jgi:hypothetical protein